MCVEVSGIRIHDHLNKFELSEITNTSLLVFPYLKRLLRNRGKITSDIRKCILYKRKRLVLAGREQPVNWGFLTKAIDLYIFD